MLLPDVNILVYAFRSEHPQHRAFETWVDGLVNGNEAYALSDHVLSGFVRIVTHPKVFAKPDSVADALGFVSELRAQPHCVRLVPGERHWAIFIELCVRTQAKGNLVADAFLAALAIEHGCEWVTTDHDYARFPGLRWRHPLQ